MRILIILLFLLTSCMSSKKVDTSSFNENRISPQNCVGFAALEVVDDNWKRFYIAEICCFQVFHRFPTEHII